MTYLTHKDGLCDQHATNYHAIDNMVSLEREDAVRGKRKTGLGRTRAVNCSY